MNQKILLIFVLSLNFFLFVFFFQKYFPLFKSSLFDLQFSQMEEKIEEMSEKIEKLSLQIENLSSNFNNLKGGENLPQILKEENKKKLIQKEKEIEKKEQKLPIKEKENLKEISHHFQEKEEKRIEKENPPQISLAFPKEVFPKEEFSLFLSVSHLKEKFYDLKISLQSQNKILSQIFNSQKNSWQSSHYYLKKIFTGPSFEGDFKLKIKTLNFIGEAKLLIKIRESESKNIVLEKSEKIKIRQRSQLFFYQENQEFSQKDCIDINSASQEDLEKLSGIGPAKAQAIIEARPFSSLNDLIRVKGIGEKTLQKIKEQGLACLK